MTTTTPLRWADADDPIASRMIFVSATADARERNQLVPAWNLYQGGCLPLLRERLAKHPRHRGRVRLISAEYGLLHPHTQVPPSISRMSVKRAGQLRPRACRALMDEVSRHGVPLEVMMLAEHPYHLVVTDLYDIPGMQPHTSLRTPLPGEHWSLIAAVLDTWGWP